MCPLTFLLLDLIVSAPTTSVSAERGFSEMKLNLSRLRSSLQEVRVQLNSSMFINNHAPSWSDDPEGVKRFLDASIERFLNSDTKRRVLSNRYSKFSKDPVKHIRTAKQTTMNSCFSQDSMKRRREESDAETDSEVDEEAAEEARAGVIFQDHLSRPLFNISGQSVSQPGPQYPCGRELSRQKRTYPGYQGRSDPPWGG